MSTAVGSRVLAYRSATEATVYMYGEGVYEGRFVPAEAVGSMADDLREIGVTNPRIRLDDGEVVYGCECWWGPVEAVRERFQGCEIVSVSIAEDRRMQEDREL